MSEFDFAAALNPQRSVVVEACAGSGKTWLLVSRILRLLLAGVKPGEILAITFTRKAAQEMQERLTEWLRYLALEPDDKARDFLRQRALSAEEAEACLPAARNLLETVLKAEPALCIHTFHGWFLQLLQNAPVSDGFSGNFSLHDQSAALLEETWQTMAEELAGKPDDPVASALVFLFARYGLSNTCKLLFGFVERRAEWWAYTAGQADALAYALDSLRDEMGVDPEEDVLAELWRHEELAQWLPEYAGILGRNAPTDQKLADKLVDALGVEASVQRFEQIQSVCFTLAGTPRARKPSDAQAKRLAQAGVSEARLLELHALICELLAEARDKLAAQAAWRFNQAGLRCGEALLQRYQQLKEDRQLLDFGDIEWRAFRLLSDSSHAEYMQARLDSRYRHILLDEFQDTNPLQWQIMEAWLGSYGAAGSQPKVFMVGDQKQSIYRFRRADARLFGVVADQLVRDFNAVHLAQNTSRRSAPDIIDAVNRVFDQNLDQKLDFPGYVLHEAHLANIQGAVQVLPLVDCCTPNGTYSEAQSGHAQGAIPQEESFSSKEAQHGGWPLCASPGGNPQESPCRCCDAWQGGGHCLRAAPWQGDSWGFYKRHLACNSPLAAGEENGETAEAAGLLLRNPLCEARAELEDQRREQEASQLVAHIERMAGSWRIADGEHGERAAEYRDIMLLVRSRTGLETYERALRDARIPFLSSRQGGLLDTLECSDLAALLVFLVTPFADLKLAQVLRSPLFSCSDDELLLLAGADGEETSHSSWWQRLCALPDATPALALAHQRLGRWLALADRLPVHDLLDRIYFEGEILTRYAAAAPVAMRSGVLANLHAFIELALNMDSGRYPSLARFIAEITALKQAPDQEAPDAATLSDGGNAVRILTVHGAKGMESPIVCLLGAHAAAPVDKGFRVLLDWPPEAKAPAHLSLLSNKDEMSRAQIFHVENEKQLDQRENLNLLYVAMTRAKQVFIMSGCENARAKESWYALVQQKLADSGLPESLPQSQSSQSQPEAPPPATDTQRLPVPPTGSRRQEALDEARLRGIRVHALLEWLDFGKPLAIQRTAMQARLGASESDFAAAWREAESILNVPGLRRFFDPAQYVSAHKELAFLASGGDLRRIDRLVVFEEAVWVLDYKISASSSDDLATLASPYLTQMQIYREAMQAVFAGKPVRCLLIFSGGRGYEVVNT